MQKQKLWKLACMVLVTACGKRNAAWSNSVLSLPCVLISPSTLCTLLDQAKESEEIYLFIIFYNHKC